MNKHVHKLTASALAISLAVIGCTPAVQSGRPTALSSTAATPKVEKDAAKLHAEAQAALQAGQTAEALTLAEQAVVLSPRDVGYRMLLGDLYLKNGRFASAETSFSDVASLDPGNVRARLSLALSMIAQGKTMMAGAELGKLDGSAAPGDLGLAYALAGQHARALQLLESAAREQEASARVRQNLALAYALAGDWQKARITASQDLSEAELPARMEQWAALAKPADSYAQVASLLGVTPAADPGQPVHLALAPVEAAPVALAELTPAPFEAIVEAAPAPVVVSRPVQPPIQLAAAARELVRANPIVLSKAAAVTSAPIPVFKPAKITKFETRPRKSAAGRYVVQIGAYRHVIQAERAWAQAQRRYGLTAGQAVSTTVTLPGRGTFHRLSVAGFEGADQAARTCGTIRARGGSCFVRTVAGDAPLQFASRGARRG